MNENKEEHNKEEGEWSSFFLGLETGYSIAYDTIEDLLISLGKVIRIYEGVEEDRTNVSSEVKELRAMWLVLSEVMEKVQYNCEEATADYRSDYERSR